MCGNASAISGRLFRDHWIALQHAIARQRPDANPVAGDVLDAGKVGQRVDINEHCRLGQPEIHRRNKTLTARQEARLIAMLGLERQSLLDAPSGNIAKGRGFHAVTRVASQWDDAERSK